MAWVAADYIGEWIFNCKPNRYGAYGLQLPKGSIKKLIGRELTWEDEPVELT